MSRRIRKVLKIEIWYIFVKQSFLVKFFKNGNERNETNASEEENVDVGKTILT